MKKIFTYLAVAALVAVACDDMYGPVETPTAPDKAGSVEIQIDTLGDDTLAFTLSPVGEVSYFSYFVAQGKAKPVDSTAVYQCAYDGLLKGTFKAAKDSVVTLTLGELTPNTPYTIYAVAGSPQGIAGSVAVKEEVTSDRITIALADIDTEVNDSTVVLVFSEKVFLGEGKVTATYYARNLGYEEMGTVEAVADSVIVEGNTVTVQFAGLPHGADWAVSYPEGAFTDSAKNKVRALASGYSAEDEEMVGVYSRKDTVAFDLDEALAEEMQMFNDWKAAEFSVGVPCDSTIAATGAGAVTANYLTPGHKLTIDMTSGVDYLFSYDPAEDKSSVVMYCPEEPAFGTTVVFSFEQDAFQDIWGNPTKEAEYATLCAYDYTLETVLGTYDFKFTSYITGPGETTMTIEALEGDEDFNVQITEIFDIECETPIVAHFEPASGVLYIPSGQYFADGQDYLWDAENNPVMGEDGQPIVLDVQLVFSLYSGEPLVLQMPVAGYFAYEATNNDELLGIDEYYEGEWYNFAQLFVAFEAEKTTATPPVESVSLTSKSPIFAKTKHTRSL